jgi:hypothetical protein
VRVIYIILYTRQYRTGGGCHGWRRTVGGGAGGG